MMRAMRVFIGGRLAGEAGDDSRVGRGSAVNGEAGLEEGVVNLAASSDRGIAQGVLVFHAPIKADADIGGRADELHVGEEDRGEGFVSQGVEVEVLGGHGLGGAQTSSATDCIASNI